MRKSTGMLKHPVEVMPVPARAADAGVERDLELEGAEAAMACGDTDKGCNKL
jgi:hypothetical protein